MDTAQIITKLSKISTRTKIGVFREFLPHIEKALRSGASRQTVLLILNESGIEMTIRTFDTYLYRSRKKHGRQTIQTNNAPSIENPPPLPQQNKPPSTSEPVKQLSGREALEDAMYNTKDFEKFFNNPKRNRK